MKADKKLENTENKKSKLVNPEGQSRLLEDLSPADEFDVLFAASVSSVFSAIAVASFHLYMSSADASISLLIYYWIFLALAFLFLAISILRASIAIMHERLKSSFHSFIIPKN